MAEEEYVILSIIKKLKTYLLRNKNFESILIFFICNVFNRGAVWKQMNNVCQITGAVAIMVAISSQTMTAATAIAATTSFDGHCHWKKTGQVLLRRWCSTTKNTHWYRVDKLGDNLEFLHFTSLMQQLFTELVFVCHPFLERGKLWEKSKGAPKAWHWKQSMFDSRWIVAMCLKYLLSCAEMKDLHVHFGATATTFDQCIWLGICCMVVALIDSKKSKVNWDRLVKKLKIAVERTLMFMDILNVVAFIDGDKLTTLNPSDLLFQNRDYNGWNRECAQNVVLLIVA